MAAGTVTSDYELKPLSLPGATGVVALDYFAYDHSTGRLWVPASNTGTVDVIDERSDAVSQVTGFKTGEVELRGRKVTLVGSRELQGLALDNERGFLFVACGDHVVSLDVGHDGKITDSIETGAGLDNIDYSPDLKVLYAAASVAAGLTIAEVDDKGKFRLKATMPTVKSARGVVAAKGETAYLIDPAEGRILKLTHK